MRLTNPASKTPLLLIALVVIVVAGAFAYSFTKRSSTEEFAQVLSPSFPEMPQHPEAEVVASYETSQGFGRAHQADLVIYAPLADVLTWYQGELPVEGWSIDEMPEMEPGDELPEDLYLRVSKDGKVAFMDFVASGEETHLSIEFPFENQVGDGSQNEETE